MKHKKIYIGLIMSNVLFLLVIINFQRIQVFVDGIQYQLHSYDYKLVQTDIEDLEVVINMQDIDSNIGEIIKINDKCYLIIDDIRVTNNNYKIYFSSYGFYDYEYGCIVTPTKYYIYQDKNIHYELYSKVFMNGNELYFSSYADINSSESTEFSVLLEMDNKKGVEVLILKDLNQIELFNMNN